MHLNIGHYICHFSVARINKININRLLVMASGTINIQGNQESSFYAGQTVVEVANTESNTKKIDLILRRHCISSGWLSFLD